MRHARCVRTRAAACSSTNAPPLAARAPADVFPRHEQIRQTIDEVLHHRRERIPIHGRREDHDRRRDHPLHDRHELVVRGIVLVVPKARDSRRVEINNSALEPVDQPLQQRRGMPMAAGAAEDGECSCHSRERSSRIMVQSPPVWIAVSRAPGARPHRFRCECDASELSSSRSPAWSCRRCPRSSKGRHPARRSKSTAALHGRCRHRSLRRARCSGGCC